MKKAINKSHDYSYLYFPLMCTNIRPKLTVGQILAYFSYLSVVFVAAAAAAKSLQSCPTLCDPIDGSP